MKEEFEEYGLSENTMYAVGAAKVSLAGLMLAGHAAPRVTRPASIGLALFMLGAIGMHIKVGDPVKRYLPALSVFSLSTISAGTMRRGASRIPTRTISPSTISAVSPAAAKAPNGAIAMPRITPVPPSTPKRPTNRRTAGIPYRSNCEGTTPEDDDVRLRALATGGSWSSVVCAPPLEEEHGGVIAQLHVVELDHALGDVPNSLLHRELFE